MDKSISKLQYNATYKGISTVRVCLLRVAVYCCATLAQHFQSSKIALAIASLA